MAASATRRAVVGIGLMLSVAAAGPNGTTSLPGDRPMPKHQTAAEALVASQDLSTRLTIQVMVDGQGPYPFVVDTGANRSVISRELAATLKLPKASPIMVDDALGTTRVSSVTIDRLEFGSREIRGINAPELAAADLGADGLLGIDSLRGQHVLMDFRAKRFLIGPATEEIDDLAASTVVVGRRRFGQLVLMDAESQTRPIFVILDSGAQNTIGNSALHRLMTFGAGHPPKLPLGTLISVTGSRTTAELDEMPEIKLGGVTIRNAPIAYADLHTFTQFHLDDEPALLLGMDILHLFRRVSVDFRRREAVFVTP